MLSPGQQLKELREKNFKTQEELAEYLGLTASSISRKEQDKVPISLEERKKILAYFKVPKYKQADFF